MPTNPVFVQFAGKNKYKCFDCGGEIMYGKFTDGEKGPLITTDGKSPWAGKVCKDHKLTIDKCTECPPEEFKFSSNTGLKTDWMMKTLHVCSASIKLKTDDTGAGRIGGTKPLKIDSKPLEKIPDIEEKLMPNESEIIDKTLLIPITGDDEIRSQIRKKLHKLDLVEEEIKKRYPNLNGEAKGLKIKLVMGID